ncbi:hypothetical protein ASD24_29530 [Paenibacillus sp. Root52]|uniref:hypothetical protein n=1 Tax=Paenibacillus sp. Root52 TaxID=1736552 RepID=UPI0006FC95FD|nr:hypothetical protein [Paenibacillus sp. Root52]KQY83751.1 hypothetical protein ASD24_29530 [Paenibacillus sp. Root52]
MLQKLQQIDMSLLHESDRNTLAADLECFPSQLQEQVTIGRMLEVIKKYHQINLCTTDDVWVIQLYELDEQTDEDERARSCCYENIGPDLLKLLYTSIERVYDRLNDQ